MKKFQLLLTNPCLKQWEDLQPASAGRYCESCEKNIVDLSNLSDRELIGFFKRKKDNVCGRVLSTQLGRELAVPSKINWQRLLPIAIGTVLISSAQANPINPTTEQHALALKSNPNLDQAHADVRPKSYTVSGRVLNGRTRYPVVGVKIKQKGFNNLLATTDSAGRFQLEIDASLRDEIFTFERDGYEITESKLADGMVVMLPFRQVIMLGGISAIPLNREPLYLVFAGKKSCTITASGLKEIPPEWIEKLEVLKDAKATALYGSKGANGVILINIKRKYSHKIDFSKKTKI